MFNPAIKNIAPVRKELSIKTFFNMLGPMVNPASPKYQLVGVFNLEIARIYNYIYQQGKVEYSIVHSLDGYDEISLTGDFKQFSRSGEYIQSPSHFGFGIIEAADIHGGESIRDSARMFTKILEGEGSSEQNAVVIANAAAALNTIYPGKDISQCVEEAKRSLLDKSALNSFNRLINE